MNLSNYVVDVSSGCVLSLVARGTVAPAVEELTDTPESLVVKHFLISVVSLLRCDMCFDRFSDLER